jgi:hypothetical protein
MVSYLQAKSPLMPQSALSEMTTAIASRPELKVQISGRFLILKDWKSYWKSTAPF